MTKQPIATPTHDAAMEALIKDFEANLDTLLIVNGALSCLSNLTLHATEDDQIVIPDLGSLIWLCDRQVNQLTNDMLLQLDKMRPLLAQAVPIKPATKK